jgi:hypothetical protein
MRNAHLRLVVNIFRNSEITQETKVKKFAIEETMKAQRGSRGIAVLLL